ncbi:MAG: ssDNA-binding domain-containing protein [Gemmataceae bacterium]|nr:ssDNA-binding domain-containing protein [Gemmataceae bacterium]
MASQSEIRERVTTEIIEALKKGVVPWRKPWSPAGNTGFPKNVVSQKNYSGVNRLLLTCAAMKKGYQSQWWGTFRQWQQRGCRVRQRPHDVDPGHWGSRIIFYQNLTTTVTNQDGDEVERTFPLLKEFCVFNAEQVDGAEAFHAEAKGEASATPDFEPAEKAIAATGADLRIIAGDKACYYRPPLDYIQIPPKAQFEEGAGGLAEWYSTALHELAHWSEVRLNWKGSYGLGELRAEMAACFMCAELAIPNHNPTENHAAYLDNWIKTISEDYRAIFKISSSANAAADYILAFSREVKVEGDEAA